MSALWLRDIGAFALQLAAIIAAGAAVWTALRVRQSTITLAYWRLLLAACLVLPLAQPWRVAAERSEPAIQAVDRDSRPPADRSPAAPAQAGWPLEDVVLAGLAAGIVARLLWVAIGAWNLRRLRRTAVRLDPVPPAMRDIAARIGARADVYVSDRIAGPITFGLIRPVVMVPPGILAMDAALQEAITSHELLHVRRRDWASVMVEEAIRTVFWFHPGIWWLIGRIQLSREHVVDDAVIRLTRSRDRYVEALIAVAQSGSPALVTAAPRFLRRRFLKKRVAQILQETTMTTRRLIGSITISAAALAVTAILAVRAFPLEASDAGPAAESQSSAPVRIVRGGDHLLHASMPDYPRRAIERQIEGDVVLEVTLDERGEVSDARVVSGPDELRRTALASVLEWHYSPESLRSTTTEVVLQFTAPPMSALEPVRIDERAVAWKIEAAGLNEAQHTERQIVELRKMLAATEAGGLPVDELRVKLAMAERQHDLLLRKAGARDAAVGSSSATLVRIKNERVPQEMVREILDRAGISIGDTITETTIRRIHEIARSLDEHVLVVFEKERGGVVLVLIAP